jgi:hypothetical protein
LPAWSGERPHRGQLSKRPGFAAALREGHSDVNFNQYGERKAGYVTLRP